VGVKNGVPVIDWVLVEPGPFLMGSISEKDPDAYKDELPQFTCSLNKEQYWISRYPVTVAQYQAFTDAGGYKEREYWTGAGWDWRLENKIDGPESFSASFETPNHPQVGVSWHEAAVFCRWLTEKLNRQVNLPTEAQWERAARHTDGRIYTWGKEFDPTRCNMGETGIGSTSAVGIFPGDAAECGAMDMCGNVREWCRTEWQDNYEDYQAKAKDEVEGQFARVLRGGAFFYDRRNVRCASRDGVSPGYRSGDIGFRVVSPGP
jgi:formylglycine-generating enzyme required for sulfatase activity